MRAQRLTNGEPFQVESRDLIEIYLKYEGPILYVMHEDEVFLRISCENI